MFATESKSVQERRVMLDRTPDSGFSSRKMRDQEPAECLFLSPWRTAATGRIV